MNKSIIFIYGIFSYIIALVAQVWFIFYIGEWEFMPNIFRTHASLATQTAGICWSDTTKKLFLR